jgi:hypothetical protein
MLEYWVWLNEIYFYMEGMDQKIKSDHHPFLIPNIPFFQYSIIPLFRGGPSTPLWGETKAESFGPGFFTEPISVGRKSG